MNPTRPLITALALAVIAAALPDAAPAADRQQFTFSWPFADDEAMRPRGGVTHGPSVTLDPEPGDGWKALQEPGLTPFERDRRAILAMAGPYRTSFDFVETVGFTAGHQPDRPYQSWSTEYVYVVEERRDFISLQHIIVMFFADEGGDITGPAVIKHWRQDWQYEDRDLHVYAGHNIWKRRRLARTEAAGTWSQAVFQVDDSPRYEAYGSWEHRGTYSSWTSSPTLFPACTTSRIKRGISTSRKLVSVCVARARASRLLPTPSLPISRIPEGGNVPQSV